MNVPTKQNPDQRHLCSYHRNQFWKKGEVKEIKEKEKEAGVLKETQKVEYPTREDCNVTKKKEAKEAAGDAGGRRVVTRGVGGVVGTTPRAKKGFANVPMRQEWWIVRGPQPRKEKRISSEHWICSVEQNQ